MKLANQAEIPALGLGVYKMAAGAEMNAAVGAAYAAGYRLFDTAQMYGNEAALSGMDQNRRTSHDPLTFDF